MTEKQFNKLLELIHDILDSSTDSGICTCKEWLLDELEEVKNA